MSTSRLLSSSVSSSSYGSSLVLDAKQPLLNEMHVAIAPEPESMDQPTATIQRDYRWRRIPSQEHICSRSCSCIGSWGSGLGNGCGGLYPIQDSRAFHWTHSFDYYCLCPLDCTYRFCYSNCAKTGRDSELCGTVGHNISDCMFGSCLCLCVCPYRNIQSLICTLPIGILGSCMDLCCPPLQPSFDITTLNAIRNASTFAEAVLVIKNTSSRMRDEIVHKHGQDLLKSIFYMDNEISLADKKQIISYISERQPHYLYENYGEMEPTRERDLKINNFLALAVINNKPDAFELLKFFLKENNFARFATQEFIGVIDAALLNEYASGNLNFTQARERTILLRNHNLFLPRANTALYERPQETIRLFSSQGNWTQELGNSIGTLISEYESSTTTPRIT